MGERFDHFLNLSVLSGKKQPQEAELPFKVCLPVCSISTRLGGLLEPPCLLLPWGRAGAVKPLWGGS